MCCNNRGKSHKNPPFFASKTRQLPKKPKLQVIGLTKKRSEGVKEGKDMELKNLKLYLENKSISEENEKLRKKASLLHQENSALMLEFRKKFPHSCLATTLLVVPVSQSPLGTT